MTESFFIFLICIHRVAADGADGDLALFDLLAHLLAQLLAALLVQLRHHQADDLAVVGRIDAHVGLLDGLFDRGRSSSASQGAMTSMRGSGEEMLPTWFSAVGVP